MGTCSVSVIIPTKNRARLLEQSILSVCEQTVAGIEIIVVDDGSIDDTAETVQRFGDKARYFYQESAGLNAARNLGLSKSQGQFIALLDDDDLWLPFKTEIQLAVMNRFPETAYVFSDFVIFDETGIKATQGLSTWHQDTSRAWCANSGSNHAAMKVGLPSPPGMGDYGIWVGSLYRELLKAPYVLPSTALIRRSAITLAAPFPADNTHCGDWQFFAELTRNAPCAFLSLATAWNRSHGDAVRLTRKSPRVRTQNRLSLIQQVWKADDVFMKQHGPEANRVEAEQLCKIAVLCLLEDRRREAIGYLDRWKRLPSTTLGLRGWLLYVVAFFPWSSRVIRLLRDAKRHVRSGR